MACSFIGCVIYRHFEGLDVTKDRYQSPHSVDLLYSSNVALFTLSVDASQWSYLCSQWMVLLGSSDWLACKI